MFGIDSGELLIIALVALVVIGPKDLPRAMRAIGQFTGRARGMAKHFRSGLDTMMREAELEDMEKLWRADNERIMREHPAKEEPAALEGEAWAEPVVDDGPSLKKARPVSASKPRAPPARGPAVPSGAAPPAPAPAPPRGDEPA